MTRKTLIVATLITLALPTLALAGGGRGPCGAGEGPGFGPGAGMGEQGHGPGLLGPRMMRALELSEEQIAKIVSIRGHFDPTPSEAELAEVRAAREELHALWSAELLDREAILAATTRLDAARDAIRNARLADRVDARIAILEVLTPAQRDKLDELRDARFERRAERGFRPGAGRRGGRGGFGPGPQGAF